MQNTVEPMCRLGNIEIVSSLAKICSNLYKDFSLDQQEILHKDLLRELDRDQLYLIALLEPSGVKVMSEYQAHINKTSEQQYIKLFLNKKQLPVILALSIFNKEEILGDISIIGYSKLLDRVGNAPIPAVKNDTTLLKYIEGRRNAFRKTYKAVSMDEFLDVIRSQYTKHIEPL